MKGIKKAVAFVMALTLAMAAFTGCGAAKTESGADAGAAQTTDGSKTFTFGDTTFNAENEEANIDPHDTYCGWACIRYGVGETLFKFNDNMELEPWVAESYENVDELTWKIVIKDGVTFSNGKAVDAAAVKACI